MRGNNMKNLFQILLSREDKGPIPNDMLVHKEVIEEINEGKYDSEISGEKTETSEEKKKELNTYFEEIKKEQERILKQKEAQAAQAAAEEKPEETPEAKKE